MFQNIDHGLQNFYEGCKILNVKVLAYSVLFSTLFLILRFPVYATELRIACNSNDSCNIEPSNAPLFSESNIVPGAVITEKLIVRNESAVDGCVLKTKLEKEGATDESFSRVMLLSISQETYPQNVLGLTPLYDFFHATDPIPLVTMNPDSITQSSWHLSFSPDADNSHQGKTLSFIAYFSLECDSSYRSPTPPPTAIPTSTPMASTSPSPNDSTSCDKPVKKPNNFEYSKKNKKIQFEWDAVEHANRYSLSIYSQSSSKKIEEVIIKNATKWESKALSQNERYRVQLTAFSECAKSDDAILLIEPQNEKQFSPYTSQTPSPSGKILGVQYTKNDSIFLVPPLNEISRTQKYVILTVYICISWVVSSILFYFFFFKKLKQKKTE